MTTRIDIGPKAKGFELNFSFYSDENLKHSPDGSLTFLTYYGFYFYLITGKVDPRFLTSSQATITQLSKKHKWVMVDDLDDLLEATLRANTGEIFYELDFENEDFIVGWDKGRHLNSKEERWLKIVKRVIANPL